jgi:hypothetical protein
LAILLSASGGLREGQNGGGLTAVASQHHPDQGEQATQQVPRPEPALPDEWLSDHQWLAWAQDYGLDLRDRDQLLDTAAVGLTVLCWRNTALEDVHAGGERSQALEHVGNDPDDPVIQAEEEQARHTFDEKLDADWDVLAEVDPDEAARIEVLLEGREQGFGIPDDIMMRLNISTALNVREVLGEVLPNSVIEPGTELTYDDESAPDHVVELVELLQDPDRLLTVGGTSTTASDLLGGTWDKYTEDVMRKIGIHLRFCDLLGTRRALWYASMSGILYASDWFPNPWWARAVDQLRNALQEDRRGQVFYFPERATSIPEPSESFWETLLAYPNELNGPQCDWVQRTRLRDFIHAVRESDRQHLGPMEDDQRFPGLALMF